ncbi:MAG: hypothetical protein JW816_00275 [Candidatus Buchananbacteria bacterium]|nr:hypothetical protein [Candidatus Buchananbacteria bacterium]
MTDRKDNQNELKLSWSDVESDVLALAEKIKQDYQPEVVVIIAEGGWVPGRLLKKYLSAQYFSFGCNNYDQNDKKLSAVEIYQSVPAEKINGRKVLIFDEVADSGETLEAVVSEIKKYQPSILKSAVLYLKNKSIFQPDYWLKNVGKTWLVYPWE